MGVRAFGSGCDLRVRVVMWACLAAVPSAAQLEFQYQFGRLTNPFSGGRAYTSILTIQHATQWKLGDSFFFIDFMDDDAVDGFNDKDAYGEWYPTISLGKLSGRQIKAGPLRDLALIGGLNFGADPNVLKIVPGVRASWQVPGFIFLNTDFAAFIDSSGGIASGGAPSTGNSFMVDVNWLLPIALAGQSFAFTGHAEYIGRTTDELGNTVLGWILAQPQFRWDLGGALGAPNRFFAGIEYQYWRNKLGTRNHDNVVQLLLVWQL